MNFLLRNLESGVAEETLVGGEQLLDNGAVDRLREVDRHLWVASVADAFGAGACEVEVKISPSRVLAGSCDCAAFHRAGGCPHFTAVLLALRKELSRRAEKKVVEKKPATARPPKLTTAVVLEHVDYPELVNFVKDYARRHRHFAIALKARFASHVESVDSKEKFVQLLDSAINMARRPDRSINQRGLDNIYKVLAELNEQREDAISRGHFTEAISIVQSIVERLTPVLSKINASTSELEAELHRNFEALHRIIHSRPAPALQQSIWAYATEEHPKLAYRNHGIDLLFLQLLLDLSRDTEQWDELLEALDRQIEKYRLEQRSPVSLLILQWQLLERAGREQAALRLVEDNLPQIDILLPAIEAALNKQKTAQARRLAEAGLKGAPEPARKRNLRDLLIRIVELENDQEALISLLKERFLETLDPGTCQRLRTAYGNTWDDQRPVLITTVRQLPPSAARREAMALLLSDEKDPHRLLDYLREAGSLDLLRRYDQQLIPDLQEEVLSLYKQFLTGYVQDHLGPKSSRMIRQTLDHLQAIGLRDLASRLVQEFRDNYPERHTLMEELSPF